LAFLACPTRETALGDVTTFPFVFPDSKRKSAMVAVCGVIIGGCCGLKSNLWLVASIPRMAVHLLPLDGVLARDAWIVILGGFLATDSDGSRNRCQKMTDHGRGGERVSRTHEGISRGHLSQHPGLG